MAQFETVGSLIAAWESDGGAGVAVCKKCDTWQVMNCLTKGNCPRLQAEIQGLGFRVQALGQPVDKLLLPAVQRLVSSALMERVAGGFVKALCDLKFPCHSQLHIPRPMQHLEHESLGLMFMF